MDCIFHLHKAMAVHVIQPHKVRKATSVQARNSKLSVASCQLQVASCQLISVSCQLVSVSCYFASDKYFVYW